MNIIVLVIVLIVILAFAIWGISYLTMIPQSVRNLLIGALILLAAALIAQQAGII